MSTNLAKIVSTCHAKINWVRLTLNFIYFLLKLAWWREIQSMQFGFPGTAHCPVGRGLYLCTLSWSPARVSPPSFSFCNCLSSPFSGLELPDPIPATLPFPLPYCQVLCRCRLCSGALSGLWSCLQSGSLGIVFLVTGRGEGNSGQQEGPRWCSSDT